MSISGRKRMLDQRAQTLSDHSFSTGDFWFDCYQAPGESPSWVKRGNWRKRHVQNDPASDDSQRDLSFAGPLGAGLARPGGRVRGGGREVLRQSRRLPGHSRPTSPCDPDPRTAQDTLPTPNPARFLAPFASGSGLGGLPTAAPAGLAPPRPATSPPPAGPPRGCASRKLPAPRSPLPASAPPPRVPERCVIGPAAPSLSGRVTALVSECPETGSGISARGAAVEGTVQPCSLLLARGSAR
nr:translation initiation factor IF-2-like [Mirounga angustirostris]